MAYNTLRPFYAQPSAGQTVVIPPFDGPIQTVFVDPTALLATLTIQLPAGSEDGQIINIVSSQTITLLTLAVTLGAILGSITTLAGNGSAKYAWSAMANKWFRS